MKTILFSLSPKKKTKLYNKPPFEENGTHG
jgi:hypothetical protein